MFIGTPCIRGVKNRCLLVHPVSGGLQNTCSQYTLYLGVYKIHEYWYTLYLGGIEYMFIGTPCIWDVKNTYLLVHPVFSGFIEYMFIGTPWIWGVKITCL